MFGWAGAEPEDRCLALANTYPTGVHADNLESTLTCKSVAIGCRSGRLGSTIPADFP